MNRETEEPYKTLCDPEQDPPESWDMIKVEDEPRPHGLYGVSKLWGENLGRMYYDEYNLSVLCIRMGHVSASGKPGWGSNYEEGNPASLGRDISIYTSHRDIAQMVRKCVEAPDSVGFDVFYALSNNKRGYRDIQHAKDVIGFEPQDSAEDYY